MCTCSKRSLYRAYCWIHDEVVNVCSKCRSEGNSVTKCRKELQHNQPNGIIRKFVQSVYKRKHLVSKQNALHMNCWSVYILISCMVWWYM